MTKNLMGDENGIICGFSGFTSTLDDAVECEKCDGELEIGFVWDRCLKCGHLQNRDFETYRPKCDRCRCYLTDDNRVNDLCKACDEYLEQSQAKQNDAVNHPSITRATRAGSNVSK